LSGGRGPAQSPTGTVLDTVAQDAVTLHTQVPVFDIHHFRMMSDGGAIEVTASDPTDEPNTGAIRSHLLHITMMFGKGDFSVPMFVHDGVPPGVTTMKLMKAAIQYTYEEIPSGGSVRIKSDDAIAVAAIHDFLRFQITEHQTGDPLESVQK
jgi:hypothetical protein